MDLDLCTKFPCFFKRFKHNKQTFSPFFSPPRFSVRNATLAFFNKKLNASEAMVENVLENLKKLKSVGTHATEVREQVDLIKVRKWR